MQGEVKYITRVHVFTFDFCVLEYNAFHHFSPHIIYINKYCIKWLNFIIHPLVCGLAVMEKIEFPIFLGNLKAINNEIHVLFLRYNYIFP